MPAGYGIDVRPNLLFGAEGAGAAGATIPWAPGIKLPRKWFRREWLRRESEWRLFRVAYTGGDEFIRSKDPLTLFSHERESERSYLDRLRRAFYPNHCAAIVGLKSDAIYQPQVLRNQGKPQTPAAGEKEDDDSTRVKRAQADDPTFEAFLEDVDLTGTNADPFWNEVCRWARTYGTMWVGIAMTAAHELEARAKAEGRQITEAEAAEARIRPYLYMAPPLSVVNWATDDRGRLRFAVAMSCEEDRIPLPSKAEDQPAPRHIARILYPDREERYLLGPQGGLTFLDSRPHPFGEVPLVPVTVRPDGRSDIEDIARIAIAVFNYSLLIDEQIYRQVFAQMVAKVKDKTAFMDCVTGTDSLITISAEENEDLFYLAPPSSPIDTIERRVERLEDAMWAIANLRSRPGAKGAQPAADVSGVAYAFEHKNAETDLAGSAVRLEEAERKIGRMRAKAVGADPSGFTVEYPRTFDIRALQSAAAEAKELLSARLGPTASAEIRKSLASKALRTLPAGVRATINQEIETLSKAEAAAGDGQKAKPSPPNQSREAPGTGAGEDRMMRAAKAQKAEHEEEQEHGEEHEEHHEVGEMIEFME